MRIRPFETEDTAAVVALWDACNLTRAWNDPYKDIARKLNVQRELFLVGVHDDRLVATVMAGFDGHRGWVNYLAIAPDCQRRGYGRALMQHVEALLVSIGCPTLTIQGRAANTAVLEFYARLGYAPDEAVSLGKRLIRDD
jgi:ribosomal protein S18 acetylase RimI-like enzyme